MSNLSFTADGMRKVSDEARSKINKELSVESKTDPEFELLKSKVEEAALQGRYSILLPSSRDMDLYHTTLRYSDYLEQLGFKVTRPGYVTLCVSWSGV